MASIKIVLRKKALSDGSYPVCLRVTKNRKTKYFKSIYNATREEWNERTQSFNKRNANYIQNNRLLLKFEDRAYEVYSQLEMENEHFYLNDFEKAFRVTENPVTDNFFYFWHELIGEMVNAGRTGNARSHEDSFKAFKKFIGTTQLTFEEVNVALLSKYESHLRSKGGTDGGISVRMRNIRKVFNSAIEREMVPSELYPFRKYRISKFKSRGIKLALDMDEINQIISFDISEHPKLLNSYNYFLFSFFTRGMNFADMMKLEWKDIDNEIIRYKRAKTKGNFRIKILPPVKKILDHYQTLPSNTKYVFPILKSDQLNPVQLENAKKRALKFYNQELKAIGKLCKIDKPLSSYVARHSFANCLKQQGVATDIISESLGHQNLAITQVYLKELDNSLLDEAAELLLTFG
jgi:integrase/recombinase XerD